MRLHDALSILTQSLVLAKASAALTRGEKRREKHITERAFHLKEDPILVPKDVVKHRDSATSSVSDDESIECDPFSDDVDVGILSCGMDAVCVESEESELGGLCMEMTYEARELEDCYKASDGYFGCLTLQQVDGLCDECEPACQGFVEGCCEKCTRQATDFALECGCAMMPLLPFGHGLRLCKNSVASKISGCLGN